MRKPEIYVSIDVEADGPAPGLHSMLALGAAAFVPDGDGWAEPDPWYATLQPLPGAAQDPETMSWWGTQPEAWREVTASPQDPAVALPGFVAWCRVLPGRPVAVGWPIAFDFAFVNYYCHRFTGGNPLGFAGLDIRSYASGLGCQREYYQLPEWKLQAMAGETDTAGLRAHIAVDDAIGQGRLFMALRRHAVDTGKDAR